MSDSVLTMATAKGTCLCGAVKLTVTGETICHLVCHCADCRRFTGSVNYGVLVKNENVEIEGEVHILPSLYFGCFIFAFPP